MSLTLAGLLVPSLASSLFCLSCLALIWLSLLTWLRTRSHALPLGIAGFLLLLAAVGSVGALTVPRAAWYALAAVPATWLMLRQAVPRLLLPDLFRRLSLWSLGIATVFVVAVPLAYAGGYAATQQRAERASAALLEASRTDLASQISRLAGKLLEISQAQGLAGAIAANDQAALARIAQPAMLSAELDNLAVTDQSSTVRYRAHLPAVSGDTLSTRYGWVSRSVQGASVHGIGLDERGTVSILAVQPILNQGAVLGLIYARASITLPGGPHSASGLHNGRDWFSLQGTVPQPLVATEGFATLVRTKSYGTSGYRTASNGYLGASTIPAPELLPGSPECWLVAISDGR